LIIARRARADRFGQILARAHVIHIAVEEIFAVRGQIAHFRAAHELVDAGDGGRLQIIDLRAGRQQLHQGRPRIRGLLGRFGPRDRAGGGHED
jgi:hypothetical protein